MIKHAWHFCDALVFGVEVLCRDFLTAYFTP
ncbi:DUF3265 domain-containing protein [Vibrio vulnificus]|nr:DUF3265 domain-containing protein [Vibrio vulnificus]